MLRERTETRLLGPQLRTGESFDASDVMAPEIATASLARASVHPQRPAIRCMRELRAGTVWINDPLTDNDAGPFGCFKQSGLGRELGCEGL